MTKRLDGPAAPDEKAIHQALKAKGVSPQRMPAFARDGIVAKSKKDALGQLAVRNISGMVTNTTQRVVKRFEESIASRDALIERLEAAEEALRPPEKQLLSGLRDNPKKSLARLIAETGCSAIRIMKMYVEGTRVLGENDALVLVAQEQPNLVKDLVRNALDRNVVCMTCVGSGKVKARKNEVEERQICPQCGGKGTQFESSAHKEFAMTKLIEMTRLAPREKGPMVQVQQNVGVNVAGGGAFMERILKTSDEVLYGRKQEIVDAEAVECSPEE
jgi:hypothetical protein